LAKLSSFSGAYLDALGAFVIGKARPRIDPAGWTAARPSGLRTYCMNPICPAALVEGRHPPPSSYTRKVPEYILSIRPDRHCTAPAIAFVLAIEYVERRPSRSSSPMSPRRPAFAETSGRFARGGSNNGPWSAGSRQTISPFSPGWAGALVVIV